MTKKRSLLSIMMTLVLALTMVFAMTTTAFAGTVTNDGPENHTYKAYQILKGTQAEGSTVLGDVEWGSGIDSTAFITALKADSTVESDFSNVTDAKSFAKAVGVYENNSTKAEKVAQIAFKHKSGDGIAIAAGTTTLANGYYLIVDDTTVTGTDDALNSALLQVTDNITIANKTDKPSVEKKVQENVKASSETAYGNGYNDVADYNIGDAVPFKLIGKVPNTSKYEKYTTYTFTDTLGDGFTAPTNTAVKVFYATEKSALNGTDLSSYFNVKVNGQVITVSLNENTDLKTLEEGTSPVIFKDGYIIVTYSATLNTNAVIGLPGNENKVDLTYTNTPNVNSDGTPGTGKTPEDKVIVFTYELDTTKVDGQDANKKLKDAEFVLYKTVDGNNKYATVGTDGKVTGWVDTEENATKLKSAETTGLFSVIGLDDGTYFLKETKAPAGYNLLTDPVEVKITATTTTTQSWNGTPNAALTKLEVTAAGTRSEGTVADGKVAINVQNNSGSTLPSTGGMGTTLFYIIGVILVLGSGVVLITRRRMSR